MDALAHRTPPPRAEKRARLAWVPRSLSGDEFTATVTSSEPSLLSTVQPSSTNPFTASLNPLCKMTVFSSRKSVRFNLILRMQQIFKGKR